MKNLLYKLANSHDLIYKVLIFLSFFVALMYVIPKEGKFKYEFTKGKRWTYAELKAPFDFSVLKTDDEILSEKERITSSVVPIYTVDSLVPIKAYAELEKEFEKTANLINLPSSIEDTLDYVALNKLLCKRVLDSIYKVGFVEMNKGFQSSFISLLNNSVAIDINKNSLWTNENFDRKIAALLPAFIGKNVLVDTAYVDQIVKKSAVPNIFYNEGLTEQLLTQKFDNISPSKGLVKKDELIIEKGRVINDEKYQVLLSLKHVYEEMEGYKYNYTDILIGHGLMVFMALLIVFLFIKTFRKDLLRSNRSLFFILLIIFLTVFAAVSVVKSEMASVYLIPFCILPILLRVFFDSRLALFIHLMTMLLIANILPNAFEFVLLQITAGIIAILSVLNLRTRSQLFVTSLLIFGAYSLVYVSNNILQEGNLADVRWIVLILFFANAFFTLFTYPLIWIFERMFGFVTDVTLLELSDTNSKLMRKLAERAPGTFQHSIQVANLAEEAIYQIGGNPLLVRTGALYHDIGKMEMPLFFVENQMQGVSPHEDMSYKESAKTIISHVIKGVEMAKKHNIPDQIIDFIRTHHGTSKARYFYQMYKNLHPDEQINEADFSYKGPVPYSRETAVLMMADSVEAASRSLKEKTPEAIEQLIDGIIATQMEEGQYQNADITFKNITVIKNIFKKKLINAYHLRIEYPSNS